MQPGEEMLCMLAHTASDPCTRQAFTAELFHQRVNQACLGVCVGLNIKRLDKCLMLRSGDVLVHGIQVRNVDFFVVFGPLPPWQGRRDPVHRYRVRGGWHP